MRSRRARLLHVLTALAIGAGTGCVERRLSVRADAAPAKVFLDGALAGEAPVSIPFTFYGTREVVVRAPGKRTYREVVSLSPPWWQLAPVDFFVEVLWPGTVVDERVVDARLEPVAPEAPGEREALLARAEAARRGEPSRVSGTAGAPGGASGGSGR